MEDVPTVTINLSYLCRQIFQSHGAYGMADYSFNGLWLTGLSIWKNQPNDKDQTTVLVIAVRYSDIQLRFV